MRTALEHDSAVWLPSEAVGAHDIHRILDEATDLQLTVTVPHGADRPLIAVADSDGVVQVVVTASTTTKVGVVVPTRDAIALWRPGSHRDHARVAANWEGAETISPLHDIALGSLLGLDDQSLVTFGATAGEVPLQLRAGVSEETAELMLFVEVDGNADIPVTVTMWVDRSDGSFSASVQEMAARISLESAYPAADADERPVFSTWYVFHQDLDQDAILRQGIAAAGLGFGTVIIDDGWQSTDTRRGYGTTGDWRIEPTKFPDARGLVAALSERGLRTMWWVGTPFIGDRSEAADRFPTVATESEIEAKVLDPRAPCARAHLIERVVSLVAGTGAHGLKLDFIERFAGADRHRDAVEAAAVTLLREIRDRVQKVSPGASIEYREPYNGPVATSLATMIRVNDCPMSPVRNRVGIVDLRLSTRGVAVHADPIMWAPADSEIRVAQHLVNALFGVPQVSVDLVEITEAQWDTLAFWIGFHNAHRRTLLHGELTAARPDLSYPTVTARREGTVITARYQPVALTVPRDNWEEWFIANTEADPTDLRGTPDHDGPVQVTIRDARGAVIAERRETTLPAQLSIPIGGVAELRRGPRSRDTVA